MDWSLVHALNGFLFHHDGVEDPLLAFVEISEALFAGTIVLVFLIAHGAHRLQWRRAAVAAVLSAGLALAVGKVISDLVDRSRPFVTHHGAVHLFSGHAADAGFPSDHATAAFAIAVALLIYSRAWGVAALVAATVLSVGRVALGVHYPSDVLAGAALGAAAALALSTPPLRRRVEALADFLGAWHDRALSWGATRVGLPTRD
jgi:undecaprenyl-diphosphatase